MRRMIVLFASLALVLSASAALAETGIGFKGIGGHVDYVKPENVDAAIGIGAIVDLGLLTPNIGLEGNLDFSSKSYDSPLFLGTAKLTFRDIIIGATAKYYFPLADSKLRPFAGAGLGINLFHSKAEFTGQYAYLTGYSYDNSETKIGIDLCGGTLYGISPKLDLLGEFRYRIVSDVSQTVLRAGVVYKLGQ